MSKINPNASKFIDTYLESKAPFANDIGRVLRALIHEAEQSVVEDWKWNTPVFQKNKIICGFAGFKKHVSLMFFNGAYLNDSLNLFTDDCSAKHSRTMKFSHVDEIDKPKVLNYLIQAFALGDTPIKKPAKSKAKEFVIPDLLKEAMNSNALAKKNYDNMAYTYRKEYALHISDAKREATKLSRLKKVLSNLEKNIKMHEQYKC